MELTELGLDRVLAEQARTLCDSGQRLARVTAVNRRRYFVRNEQGEVPAELTGKFLYAAASSVDVRREKPWWLSSNNSLPADAALQQGGALVEGGVMILVFRCINLGLGIQPVLHRIPPSKPRCSARK